MMELLPILVALIYIDHQGWDVTMDNLFGGNNFDD